jgi:aspartyl-tRNA synthetase
VAAEHLRHETVIQVQGKVRERPAESVNDKLATGRMEVLASTITVLNAVKGNLPFPVSVHDEENTREELRLRHRYLDLRRERMNRNLRLRHQAVQAMRRHLEDAGFIEVETPVLTRSTPEGARDYLVPSRVCGGEWFALPQSPQLFKQLLMVGGIERYYQVARCFRDEDLRADRQPEFTQLDMEMSFMDQEQILELNEGLIAAIWQAVKGIELPRPFPRLTWHEAMDRYGTDRPDTRYGLELTDVSDLVADMGFKVFSGAVAAGGSVKCIAVPGGNDAISNVRIKPGGDVFSEAQKAGAGGLAFIRVREGGEIDTIGAIKDNLPADKKAELLERSGAEPGTLLLFGAGDTATVNKALDRVRQFLARELGLVRPDRDNDSWNFLWVVDFPMFEFNAGRKPPGGPAPPLLRPQHGRPRGRSGRLGHHIAHGPGPGLRPGAQRPGAGRRLIAHPRFGPAAPGAADHRPAAGGGRAPVRLPDGSSGYGRAAPRRPGLRRGPDRDAAGRRGVDPRHDRLPQNPAGPLPDDPGPADVSERQLEELHVASTWTEEDGLTGPYTLLALISLGCWPSPRQTAPLRLPIPSPYGWAWCRTPCLAPT